MKGSTEKKNLILDVNEKPKIWQWIILAFQHVFAMFGATVLVPILVNSGIAAAGVEGEALSIAVALVTAGIGTLIYIICTRAKSPVFLGSSFAFISPVIAAYIAGGLGGAMTGIMVVGLIYFIVSLIIRFAGKKWIDKVLPPIVIGPMIMIIGLSLAGSAVSSIFDTSISVEGIEWKGPVVALITFLVTALTMTRAKGFLKIIPFLVGIIIGYIAACIFGLVDFTAVGNANWFQVPNFHIPFVHYTPDIMIALTMAPIALVTMAEHIGDHKALSTIMDRDLLQKPGLENTMMGDGIATFIAGFLGGPANTTYGENTAVVGMTRIASVWVIGLAAIIAIVLGFFGKFTAIVSTIPNPVLGGVSLLLYGFIAVNGLKVLIQNNIDFTKNKNIIIASAMLVLGLGGAAFSISTGNGMAVQISGMSLAAIVGILLNLLLPSEKDDNKKESPSSRKEEKINVPTISKNGIISNTKFKNVIEMDHPLIEHKLGILRNKKTGTKEFREIVGEIGAFMCYKALKDAKLDDITITTPITKTKGKKLDEDKYAFVPILRAGMGMLDGVTNVVPNAKIGHIGMYRDDANGHKPVEYFCKLPKHIERKEVFLLDPMLATGGSATDAIESLKKKKVKKIKFLCIIAAPEGLAKIEKKYPDVQIYCAHIDEKLNKDAYIVPGLGDAGDRIFGTK